MVASRGDTSWLLHDLSASKGHLYCSYKARLPFISDLLTAGHCNLIRIFLGPKFGVGYSLHCPSTSPAAGWAKLSVVGYAIPKKLFMWGVMYFFPGVWNIFCRINLLHVSMIIPYCENQWKKAAASLGTTQPATSWVLVPAGCHVGNYAISQWVWVLACDKAWSTHLSENGESISYNSYWKPMPN